MHRSCCVVEQTRANSIAAHKNDARLFQSIAVRAVRHVDMLYVGLHVPATLVCDKKPKTKRKYDAMIQDLSGFLEYLRSVHKGTRVVLGMDSNGAYVDLAARLNMKVVLPAFPTGFGSGVESNDAIDVMLLDIGQNQYGLPSFWRDQDRVLSEKIQSMFRQGQHQGVPAQETSTLESFIRGHTSDHVAVCFPLALGKTMYVVSTLSPSREGDTSKHFKKQDDPNTPKATKPTTLDVG